MSKIRIIVAEFEGDGDTSLDFLAALRGALGVGPGDVMAVRQSEPAPSVALAPAAEPARQSKPAPPMPVTQEPRPIKAQVTPTPKPVDRTPPRRVFPRSGEPKQSIASQVLAAFREDPATLKPDLAKRIYGNALPENVQKLQSQIYMLCNTGKLKRLGMGRYEVVS